MSSNEKEEDPIDSLLNQATVYAAKNAQDDTSFTDFDYKFPSDKLTSCNDVLLNDKHDLIHVRSTGDDDDSSDVQRGMYAKCDIEAGTVLVTSRPIVVHWDVEDDDDDASDDDEDEVDSKEEGEESEDNESTDKKLKADAAVAKWAKGKPKQKVQSSIEMAALLKRSKKDYEEDLPPGFNLYNDANSDDDKSADRKLKADDSSADSDDSADADDDDDNSSSNSIQGATGSTRNGILILRSIEKIKQDKSLWTNTLSKLYPRSIESALNLPPWFCSDVTIGMEIENQCKSLSSVFKDDDCNEISTRLPLIIRYNVLSIETCSELFVYPDVRNGGMANLAGTGLYGPEISYFNHSCTPNVSRYCIGDVMFFVTNRDVKKGDELCFSYIEHEFLGESGDKRTALLDMDFSLKDDEDGDDEEKRPSKKQKKEDDNNKTDEVVYYPNIDSEMQSELMATPPIQRLDLINELLSEKVDPLQDFKSDRYQLHILKAITLEQLGRSNALEEWEMAIDFAIKTFPPLDETIISLRVQAALCASVNSYGEWQALALTNDLQVGDIGKALDHTNKALEMHVCLFSFGDGTQHGKDRFLRRYCKELFNSSKMRPSMSEAQLRVNLRLLFGITDDMWEEE